MHVKGTWAPCHARPRHWRERSKAGEAFTGRIINTTSGAGLVGNFGQTNYATAKAGIAGLTQTLSLELFKLGVTVNCVGPAAATRITGDDAQRARGHRGRRRPRATSGTAWTRRSRSPLVAWLASDEAQHVTGQVIRAVGDEIVSMKGWSRRPDASATAASAGTPPSSAAQLATDIFGTRAPGLRY